jgi:molybdopterin-guanine dinucleotide biosynthesis protein A
MVPDVYPGKGALVGVYSGLKAAATFYSLVVACDMPFLNIALLRHLMELSPGFDIVIPKLEGKLEPLHAVYSKGCLGPIEDMLGEDWLKVTDLPDRVRARYVGDDEVEMFDPEHDSFLNVNSESDLQRAKVLLEKERAFLNI